MTDIALIIAVAKLDWWKYNKAEYMECWEKDNNQLDEDDLPSLSYLTSRDAIIPVIEKTLKSSNDWFQFFLNLGKVCRDIVPDQSAVITNYKLVLLATPKQLSIALVKATGKWTEE